MSMSRNDERPPGVDTSGGQAGDAERTDEDALLLILERVLAVCCSRPRPGLDVGSLERWEDEYYVYFEARLHDTGRDMDINVHDGLLHVRLKKAPEGPQRAD
jgi:hypothetical protein